MKGIAEAAKQPLVALVALVGFNHWAVEAKNDMLANIARFGMGFANVFSLPLMFSSLTEVIQKWYTTLEKDSCSKTFKEFDRKGAGGLDFDNISSA